MSLRHDRIVAVDADLRTSSGLHIFEHYHPAKLVKVGIAEQNLIAANARIGVAKTGYFPTLSLAAAIGLATDNVRWLFAETARTGLLGAGRRHTTLPAS